MNTIRKTHREAPTKKLNDKAKRKLQLLLYLLPFVLMVVIFNYIPIFGWIYAFIDYMPGVPIADSKFVGLKYFKMVFSKSSDYWIVLRNTLAISFLNLIALVIPVILALMISQVRQRRFSKIVQTMTSIPNFISWVIVFSMVFMLLSSENSAMNVLLMKLNLIDTPMNLLIDSKNAWFIQVAISVWKSVGYNAILYLAAISGIDQELYDAADVDGANTWHKMRYITIPGILPTFFVILLLSISNMLSNGFEQFWLFGNGMTWDKLEVFDTYVYRMGIHNMEYSFSTAVGIFKSIVSIILLTVANGASKKVRGNSIF